MNRKEIHSILSELSLIQMDVVLVELQIPRKYLTYPVAPAQRAIEIVTYAESHGCLEKLGEYLQQQKFEKLDDTDLLMGVELGEQWTLLAELGWACFSLIHPPSLEQLAMDVRRSVLERATDLTVIESSESTPNETAALVDLIGRRTKARLGKRAQAAFMLGCLGPAMIEHHHNPNYLRDLASWYRQAHDRNLSTEQDESISRIGECRDIEAIHSLVLSLVRGR